MGAYGRDYVNVMGGYMRVYGRGYINVMGVFEDIWEYMKLGDSRVWECSRY